MLHCESSFETNGDGGEPRLRGVEVVSGPGGRRRSTRKGKLRIIAETIRPGASVAKVAGRHGHRTRLRMDAGQRDASCARPVKKRAMPFGSPTRFRAIPEHMPIARDEIDASSAEGTLEVICA